MAPSEPFGGPSGSAGDRADVPLPRRNLLCLLSPPLRRAQLRSASHTRVGTGTRAHTCTRTASTHRLSPWLAVALSAPSVVRWRFPVSVCAPPPSGVHGAVALVICFCSCRTRGTLPSPDPRWAEDPVAHCVGVKLGGGGRVQGRGAEGRVVPNPSTLLLANVPALWDTMGGEQTPQVQRAGRDQVPRVHLSWYPAPPPPSRLWAQPGAWIWGAVAWPRRRGPRAPPHPPELMLGGGVSSWQSGPDRGAGPSDN